MEEEAKYKLMWKVGAEGQCQGSLRWPPRSYCCSFCSREFMSAQALGGHMNVHRRDRARLNKLYPIRRNEDNHVQINQYKSTDKLITWVAASSSSSSGSGSQGEKVLEKQKLWEDFTVQITASSKYNLQNPVGVKDFGKAIEDLDLELRL